MNTVFAVFAGLGLIFALLIKIIFSSAENSFYPTLGVFVFLLITFHRLCYLAIVEGRFKDMGEGRRLTDASIVDSVYYLGFTYTLLILITSFISIGQEAGTIRLKYDSNLAGLMDILNRFCVGLFTTGYGLVARIQLSNLIEIEDVDPEGLREKLNVKTAALINVIDQGASSLATLIVTSNKAIVDSVTNSTNSLTQQSNHLSENLSGISDNLSKVLSKLKKQVSNLDLTDATGAIEAHLSITAKGVEGLNQSIDVISNKFSVAGDEVGNASQKLISVMVEINSQYENLHQSLSTFSSGLVDSTNLAVGMKSSIQQSTTSVEQFKNEIHTSILSLTKLTENLNECVQKLAIFSTSTGKVQTDLFLNADSLGGSMKNSASLIEQNVRILSERIIGLNATLADIQKKISYKFFK
jgi:ABC-type transporter Mla subunit MlaD